MTPAEFQRIGEWFPDAALLLTRQGGILAVNQRAAVALGQEAKDVIGRPLAELAATSGEAIRDYLRLCSRSPQPVIGALLLRDPEGHARSCRCYGLLAPGSEASADTTPILLRLERTDAAASQFAVLNQKIAELTEEIRRRKNAEDSLRLVTDNAPVLIAHCDREHRFKFVNRPYAARFGLEPEDLLGRGVAEVLGPEAHAVIQPYMAQALAGQRVEYEAKIPYRDLGLQEMQCAYAPQFDDAGQVVGYVAVISNISERRQIERSLRQSEERFARFMENLPGLAWIKDLEGRYVYANDAAIRVFRRSQADIAGRTDDELFSPETAAQFKENDQRALADGKGVQVIEALRHEDGAIHYSVVSKFPIPGPAGGATLIGGIAIDITDHKRAEADARFLADASAALADLVDYEKTLQRIACLAVPSFADWCAVDMLSEESVLQRLAVAHADPSKVELARDLQRRYPLDPSAPQGVWNILRTGRSEIIPRITDDLLVQSVRDPELLRALRALKLRSYIGVPMKIRGKVLGALTFITAESGRAYEARDLALAEDLAYRAAVAVENARLYQALTEAARRKDEFLALLGHELRNPMAPIRNALQILKLPGVGVADAGQARAIMERQLQHLVRLVDDLLDVSRIMRGKIELRCEPVQLRTVIARAVETAQPLIDAAGHALTVVLAPEPLWVHGDLVRLVQVVANLLDNAAKYTEKGGQINVRAAREGSQAVMRVKDTGIGLSPDMRSRIFDMFFQAERRTTDARGGLGIGLSLTRALVEMHGGTMEVHSAGPGQGSEFVVRLPLLHPAEG